MLSLYRVRLFLSQHEEVKVLILVYILYFLHCILLIVRNSSGVCKRTLFCAVCAALFLEDGRCSTVCLWSSYPCAALGIPAQCQPDNAACGFPISKLRVLTDPSMLLHLTKDIQRTFIAETKILKADWQALV